MHQITTKPAASVKIVSAWRLSDPGKAIRQNGICAAAAKIRSLINFSKQYKGHFILRVVIFKGYNDTEEQLPELKKIVDQIDYDELSVGTRPTGKMGDRFAVSDERLEEIRKYLES